MLPGAGIWDQGDGVFAVDTEYTRPLVDASHLIVEGGRAAFVDTGVNSSVPLLLAALAQQDIDVADVDYVFLTHIHLDHAGGAGELMQALPNAMCVVHPRGARHMVNPSKLVAGAEAVYGAESMQRMYGTIRPIDAARITEASDEHRFSLNGRELTALYTEGHARHHYVLHDPASRAVFTGDSFGISYRELDTENGAFIFPSSTPIDFDPDAAHRAYDRILGCEPERCFLTHFSEVRGLAKLADDLHADIEAYRRMASDAEDAIDRKAEIKAALNDYLSQRLRQHGFDGDTGAIDHVLAMDVELNAQGLDVWLDRR